MRCLILIFVATIFMTGCAQEAYYADQEYGIASMDAYDQQIVHKDYVHADKDVNGMEGLHAEPTMEMFGKQVMEVLIGQIFQRHCQTDG